MANRTDVLARDVHGTNPQNLVEKIVRLKVYSMTYWKEHCFGLNAETLVDKAMDLDHVGGTYGGNQKATDFLCLVLKMCQIQPEKEIVVEFIKNEDYKYVRALGAFYMRLVGTSLDVYQYLEPLYNDYRKLRVRNGEGTFQLSHVDEFVDEMLTKDFLCNIALPRIPTRWTLEASTRLEPRISALEDFEELEEDAAEQAAAEAAALEKQAQEATFELERARERARGGGGPLPGPPARGGRPADNVVAHNRMDRHHRERDHERHAERGPKDSERAQGERERVDRRDSHRHDDNDRNSHRRHEDRERRRDDRDGRYGGRDERHRSPERRERREEAKKRRSRSSSPARQDRREKKREKRHTEEQMPSTGGSTGDVEIDEANALRAKLGLKPLR